MQKDILTIALENKKAGKGGRERSGADVYYVEVLHQHFGWPFKPWITEHWHAYKMKGNAGVLEYMRGRDEDGKPTGSAGGQFFSKEQIGEGKYNADMAALSRSMLRLQKRGLVICLNGASWAGANITEAGVIVAQKL